MLLLFLIESGAKVISALSWDSPRGMPLLLVLVMAVVGLIIAWRWEAAGGALAVVGGGAIVALAYLASGPAMLTGAFLLALPLLVAGVLYLTCSWRVGAAAVVQEYKTHEHRSESSAAIAWVMVLNTPQRG